MTPQSETDLAEMIRAANAPLSICGGGTRPIGHPVEGEALHTTALTGIELYEPGSLTLVVKAGTPMDEIEQALLAEGQRLAFEPMDHQRLLGTQGTPTIGGAIALNTSGPRRIQVGAARDFMLGVRFVDGRGQVISNGGRVMKNVTGYDLVKLMAGSYGTLGVMTEVSLKVLPVPDTQATLILHGLDLTEAVQAMAASLGSPFEVSGAAHLPTAITAGASETLLRVEGFASSVSYRIEQLKALLAEHSEMSVIENTASLTKWHDVRDVSCLADQTGDVWRISTKPSAAPDLIARMDEGTKLQLDWGGGLIWALAPEGTDLRRRLGTFDGHATLIRATEESRTALPVFHPQTKAINLLETGLRMKFDPRGLLNSGLMGASV